ncbi:hypothetical protein L873DRAFT_1831312 [Choiromyces venosus 120613-1]|uniref:Uncharacterized protein n=1 Tax=Choiromyces venosus 120613-1 TaxID=1336337 RepID=A0A3N4J3Z0_9PEZI|nr:hypothetical protein L873DRAFT_1831312 [Choiromyces venosus 120613-1]
MSDNEDSKQFAKERPISTIARSFSAQLNDAFLIDDTLDQLSSTVEQKKLSVTFHSKELEELEARIRRAEALLEEKKKRFSQQLPGEQFPDPPAPSTYRARQPLTNYDQPESSQAATAPPNRPAPPPPVLANGGSSEGGFVVIEKSASMPGESGNAPPVAAPVAGQSERRFGEQYSARPPPPVPT